MQCPELARSEIELLRADGIEPTLDELAELFELAKRVESPFARTNPIASRAPIAVGSSNLRLWPLSLRAEAWLEQHAAKLSTFGAALVGYAAAFGREPGTLESLATWNDIAGAVIGRR